MGTALGALILVLLGHVMQLEIEDTPDKIEWEIQFWGISELLAIKVSLAVWDI